MEFDANWILLGLPIAFSFGWLASRFDLRQLRMENRQAPKAYFKGLNFLLNEQQDQAIDAFIEAVQNDPDTSELHFALRCSATTAPSTRAPNQRAHRSRPRSAPARTSPKGREVANGSKTRARASSYSTIMGRAARVAASPAVSSDRSPVRAW